MSLAIPPKLIDQTHQSGGKVHPKVPPERARREAKLLRLEAKLQRLVATLDEQQLQLVIELARAVTRAGKKKKQ